jgi:hypothetical protein
MLAKMLICSKWKTLEIEHFCKAKWQSGRQNLPKLHRQTDLEMAWDRFSHKRHDILFWPGEEIFWGLGETYTGLANKRQFKQAAFPSELQAGHPDHHLQCPTAQVAIRESLKTTWRNQAMKSAETKPLPTLKNMFYLR